MEQVYRGYPQPYMVYDRENQALKEAPWDARRRMQQEFDYFRGLYPMEAKRLQRVAETEFDRIDRDGGPMYDEYPDREFLYQTMERMIANALAEGIEANRDLMHVVLLHELLRRRAMRV